MLDIRKINRLEDEAFAAWISDPKTPLRLESLAVEIKDAEKHLAYMTGYYKGKSDARASAQSTNNDVWDAALEEAAAIFDAPVRAVLLNSDVCELIRALKSTSAQGGDK